MERLSTFFLAPLSFKTDPRFKKTTVVVVILFLSCKYFLNFLLRDTFDIFDDWQSQIPGHCLAFCGS